MDENLREGSQWFLVTLALWLVVALGLANGAAGMYLYSRVVSSAESIDELRAGNVELAGRVATLEAKLAHDGAD